MTAYQLTPVGAEGPEHDRAEQVEVRSYRELMHLLAETQRARDVATEMWRDEVDRRIAVQQKLNRASRVLASLGRLSPRMAAAVEGARREIWRLDR